jgi:hypothetical protein
MSRVFRRGGVVITILLLACCGNVPKLPYPPRTLTFDSPLYLPQVYAQPNKLGVAGGDAAQVAALGAAWHYTWSIQCDDPACVPMIWGAADVDKPATDSAWLLGFNEPDLAGQANLTPQAAALLWHDVEARYPERKLVAPAPSHEHFDWLLGFYAAYVTTYGHAPRLDALALHCYLPTAAECIALGRRFVGLAQAWDIAEVWVTEFAFVPAYSYNAEREARAFVTWLEQTPRITRYAPFVAHIACDWSWPDCRKSADPSLFDAFGQLTEMGTWYVKDKW